MMLERIGFRVIHVTSQDPAYPGDELERHGPTVNGWRSVKNPNEIIYPQEVILQLESRFRIGHIQLLGHQYLIPEKIELYIGENTSVSSPASSPKLDVDNIQFILLGHVTMSTNLNTGFKVRELKSVTVECRGEFVKLLLYQNYANKYNPHKQVSLVAINLLGDKFDNDIYSKAANRISFQETTQSERDKSLFSPYEDLTFTMYVGTEVQDLIRKMDQKKQDAVLDERFDFASKLKYTIEQLRKSGEVLAKYQLEKQIAAAREDFAKANEKKTLMDTYRDNLYKTLRINKLLEPNGRIQENDEPGKFSGLSGLARSMTELSLTPPTLSTVSTPESTTSERFTSRLTTPDNDKKDAGYQSNDEPKHYPQIIKKRRPLERVDQEIREERCPHVIQKLRNMSDRAKRYAALPVAVFGEPLVEKIFSKNFIVKEDGLMTLHNALAEYKRGDKNDPPSKIFRATIVLLQRTVKDIIFSVFNLTIQTLLYLMDDFSKKHRMPGSEISQGLERMLPELLLKSGDTAMGKNKVATDCILKLQSCQHIRSLNVISVHLTRPFDTPVHPRLALSKTEMVEELLNIYGISSERNSGTTSRDYVEFGVSALNQPSDSVRRVAERIIVHLYQKHPRLVRQNLPLEQDVSSKNIQYRQLFQKFDKVDSERKEGTSAFKVALKDTRMRSPLTASVYIPKI